MTDASIGFERAARLYDATRGFSPDVAQAVAAVFAVAARLAPTSRVLEIGVGTGRIALPLAPAVARFIGIDIARPMLDVLVEKRADERIDLCVADATRLPFADASFDATLAIHVLHLIPGWRAAVAELGRVVRPGGTVLVNGRDHLEREPLNVEWNAIRAAHGIPFQGTAVGVEDTDRIADALTAAGFTEREAGTAAAWTSSVTPAHYLADLERRAWSSTWSAPEEPYQAALADLRAYLARERIPLDEPLATTRHFRYLAFRRPAM